MRKMWRKLFTTAALAFMLCLAGLILSGTAFADRCVDNGDGTVTDNGTGLMWQKATAGPMNFHDAWSYASGLSLGGHSDWELPAKEVLVGLYNSECKNLMDVLGVGYWSSTTYIRQPYVYAWVVYFLTGFVYGNRKSLSYYVLAVRSAQ